MAVGIRCADHVTPLYPQKLALTSPTGGGRSVGIVRSRTKATEFSFSLGSQFLCGRYEGEKKTSAPAGIRTSDFLSCILLCIKTTFSRPFNGVIQGG